MTFLFTRMVLGNGTPVANIGVRHSMEEHVHATDPQDGVIEVAAVEQVMVEVGSEPFVVE